MVCFPPTWRAKHPYEALPAWHPCDTLAINVCHDVALVQLTAYCRCTALRDALHDGIFAPILALNADSKTRLRWQDRRCRDNRRLPDQRERPRRA